MKRHEGPVSAEEAAAEKKSHGEKEHPEKLSDTLLNFFHGLLLKKNNITLEEPGMFVTYGPMSYVDQKLLADANSELREYIQTAFRDLLKRLNQKGRDEVNAAKSKHAGNILFVLMDKDPSFPNIFALFEKAKQMPKLN